MDNAPRARAASQLARGRPKRRQVVRDDGAESSDARALDLQPLSPNSVADGLQRLDGPARARFVMRLGRSIGNAHVQRVVATHGMVQRAPAVDTTQAHAHRAYDPIAWIGMARKWPVIRNYPDLTVVVAAANTAYQFQASGGAPRELGVQVLGDTTGATERRLDVTHAEWRDRYDQFSGEGYYQPLTEDGVKALCAAMGLKYGGEPTWILLVADPELYFMPPTPGRADATARPDPAVAGRRAKKMVKMLARTWRERTRQAGAAPVSMPTFQARFSERTGWHIRVTVDGDSTEVPLRSDDTAQQVRDRVSAAVNAVRAKQERRPTDRPKVEGAKSDPRAPAPPEWYMPFKGHAAVQEGKALANLPPLPAEVLFTADESNRAPTVKAGAVYDFRMRVEFQLVGQLGGIAEAMDAGYYWEELAATKQDWYESAGVKPPEQTPPVDPGSPRTKDLPMGSGTRVTRGQDMTTDASAQGRHVRENLDSELEEDDYLGVAGETVAGGFRIAKTAVLSGIGDVLDHRLPDRRRVRFPEPGYYLVRCIAGPRSADEDSNRVRSPSVAVIAVVAEDSGAVARASAAKELAKAGDRGAYARYTSELEAARNLRKRLAADPTLRSRIAIDPIGASKDLSDLEVGILLAAAEQGLSDQQLRAQVGDMVEQGERKDQPEVAGSWHEQLKKRPNNTNTNTNDTNTRDYPVGATFVSDDSGQEIQLRLMIGQAADSTEAAPHWLVFDITTADTRRKYEGRAVIEPKRTDMAAVWAARLGQPAAISGAAGGHRVALKNALRQFAGTNPYGYGEIGLAWPAAFDELDLKGSQLPPQIRSKPNAEKRAETRHRDYVEMATLLIPIAKVAKARALITAAEAFVGALGAKNAVEALRDRAGTHHLLEFGTLLELTQVIGGVKTLGMGAHAVFNANEFVRAARRVGAGLQVLSHVDNGIQLVTIPFVVEEQLRAIDALAASDTRKAALVALVFGRAIKTGVVAVRGLRPGEQVHFYDDSKQTIAEAGRAALSEKLQLAALQNFANIHGVTVTVRREPSGSGEPGHAEQVPGTLHVDLHWPRSKGREPPMSEADRTRLNRRLLAMNIGVVPAEHGSGGAPLKRISPQDAPETAPADPHPTVPGTPRRALGGVDANAEERSHAVAVLNERFSKPRPPHSGPPPPAPPTGAYGKRTRSADDAVATFDSAVAAARGREVGLFYNPRSGEFAVHIGTEFDVHGPTGTGWRALVHVHPNPDNVPARRLPAPADILHAVRAAKGAGTHVEFVQSERPDGTVILARVVVTGKPPSIVVELPAQPGESPVKIVVTTPDEYAVRYQANDDQYVEQGSPLHAWMIRDLHAYNQARREGTEHGTSGGRTAAGTAKAGDAATSGGGAPKRRRSFRAQLTRSRPDLRVLFAHADQEHRDARAKGPLPSQRFDALMRSLEEAGLTPEGRRFVLSMFKPGREGEPISEAQFNAALKELRRVRREISANAERARPEKSAGQLRALERMADEVLMAYRRGETVQGNPIQLAKSPQLAEAMERLRQAFAEYRETPDPVERLIRLRRLRDEIVLAEGTLRNQEVGRFTSGGPPVVGKPTASTLVPGIQEALITYAPITGIVTEPQMRAAPGSNLNQYLTAASEFRDPAPGRTAKQPLIARNLRRLLSDMLAGYHRAHAIGPGFGGELFEGMTLAPEDVNLDAQNKGVEHFVRKLAETRATVELTVQPVARRLFVPLNNGEVLHVDLLTRIEYTIKVNWRGKPEIYRVVIGVTDPPDGEARILLNTVPPDLPGGKVLANLKK